MRISEYNSTRGRPRSAEGGASPERRSRALPVAIDVENIDSSTNGNISHGAPNIIIDPYNVRVWIDDEDLVEQRRHIDDAFRYDIMSPSSKRGSCRDLLPCFC